jgi:DNA-binding response OmpR family regulator
VKILVADDDVELLGLVAYALRQAGYLAVEAPDGPSALEAFQRERPDLVVLDYSMPRLNGFEVLRRIREQSRVPVMMLTVRAAEEDVVAALDLGADDHLAKPFSPRTLLARVRALLRRAQNTPASAMVFRGRDLVVDFDAVAVTVNGATVRLTRREFELLKCLVENQNRVMTRDRLLERVWGYDKSVETRSVDVHVGRLRAKLGNAGRQIETVVGLGYRFVEP